MIENEEGKTRSSLTFEYAGGCLKCNYVLPPLAECAAKFFQQGYVECSRCGDKVDLWKAALDRAIALDPTLAWALQSLGAGQTTFVMSMKTGNRYAIDLTQHGVPENAKIIARHYTTQGPAEGLVTATEWHHGDWTHRLRGTVLHLLAIPIMEGPLPRIGQVLISVTWIRTEESIASPYLVTAFEAAAAGDYGPSMVFAQAAVEVLMMPLVEKKLTLHVGSERVKNFMTDSLSYGHALNVLLPYLCGEASVSKMPDVVRGALNRLRKTRNDIIHGGPAARTVTSKDALEGICAAVFGLEYVKYATASIVR
jgi:hypothetical protein